MLAEIRESEFRSIEIRQSVDGKQVLLSRTSTREAARDYLESTARCFGSYYESFPVEAGLCEAAVTATLEGVADALDASPLPDPDPGSLEEGLGRRLLRDYKAPDRA